MRRLIALFAIVVLLVNGAYSAGDTGFVASVSKNDIQFNDRANYIIENGLDVEVSGIVEAIIREGSNSEIVDYFLKGDDGRRYKMYGFDFFEFGKRVSIRGRYLETDISDEEYENEYDLVVRDYNLNFERGGVASEPSLGEYNLGEYKVALILINTGNGLSSSQARQRFESMVSSKIASWSYGKTYLNVEVFGPYNLPGQDYCDSNYLDLVDQYIDFSKYKGVMVVFPKSACSGTGGLSTIGPGGKWINGQEYYFSSSKINGVDTFSTTDTPLHEFGHQLGLNHATDSFDVMASGYGRSTERFNAAASEHIGWLDESNVLQIDDFENSEGEYVLESLDIRGEGLKALKIKVADYSGGGYYYFSYRSPCQSVYCDSLNVHNGFLSNGAIISGYFRQGETFYLDPSETYGIPGDSPKIVLTVISSNNNQMRVFVGKYHCGNGVIDKGEQCDSANLRGLSCEDEGYEFGNLACSSSCDFDYSLCRNIVCSESDEVVGNRICRTEILADNLDGTFNKEVDFLSEPEVHWKNILNSDSADSFSQNSRYNLLGFEYDTLYGTKRYSSLSRILIPFDTSKIPDSAKVIYGEIFTFLATNLIVNTHPESNDLISIVPYSFNDISNLGRNNFDDFLRVRLAEDKDVSLDLSDSRDLRFNLNNEGLNHISTGGYTYFGMINGYDFDKENIDTGSDTKLRVAFYSGDLDMGVQPPKLFLTYRVPEFSFIENNDDREVSGNLNLKIEKLVGESYLIYSSVYSGNVNVAPKSKLRLADYWGGASLSESGKYRAIVEFKVGEKTYRDEKEFYVRPESCGNGAVDSGEQCDSANLASFGNGIGQCKYYDSDFVYGDLRCNDACQFDLSSCFVSSGRACASGDRNNGDGTCTAVLTSLSRDGTFSSSNSEGFSWKDFVRRNVADSFDSSGLNFEIANRYLLGGMSTGMYIKRPLISFDTSKIPDEASIIGATLYLRTFVQSAPHISDSNYQNDFVTLVDIGVSGDGVQLSDYGNVGEELVSRDKAFRVRGAVMNKEYSLSILSDKLNVVDKTGISDFALRAGLELDNNIPSNRPNTLISTRFYSSESSYKPRLEVTYFP